MTQANPCYLSTWTDTDFLHVELKARKSLSLGEHLHQNGVDLYHKTTGSGMNVCRTMLALWTTYEFLSQVIYTHMPQHHTSVLQVDQSDKKMQCWAASWFWASWGLQLYKLGITALAMMWEKAVWLHISVYIYTYTYSIGTALQFRLAYFVDYHTMTYIQIKSYGRSKKVAAWRTLGIDDDHIKRSKQVSCVYMTMQLSYVGIMYLMFM